MRILVTGGRGFLGKNVVNQLEEIGHNPFFFSSNEYDLRNEVSVKSLFSQHGPFDAVVHLAADVGGIGYNRAYPGSVLFNNAMMNLLIQEYARRNGVKKFVGIGSVCSYPKITEIPFKEESLWQGYPEETNAPYGISKLIMLEQSKAYQKQYEFRAIHLLMINLYGPEDNFDPESSHVVPALIKKIVEGKRTNSPSITLWGDGSPSREFLFVEDAARAIVLALESYESSAPMNIGSGEEIAIRDLAELIRGHVGFAGEIVWDTSKPNGQPRRCLDITRARQQLGFKPQVPLKEGLARTIEWYVCAHPERN
jgi:GDP-L-fucose synthase